MERCLAVMPTYNEGANLAPLVEEILLVGDLLGDPRINVLIIDDHSPDGTGAAADSLKAIHRGRVDVLHRLDRLGVGSAYVVGFRYALASGYDYVVQIDADFSNDPSALPGLLRAARSADVALGIRYGPTSSSAPWPLWRQLLSRTGSYYARLMLGMPVSEPTGGFKCFRRSALLALDLSAIRSNDYAFQVEVTYRCLQAGLRVTEVPVGASQRRRPRSRLAGGLVWETLLGIWQLRFGTSGLRPVGPGRAPRASGGGLARVPISSQRVTDRDLPWRRRADDRPRSGR